MKPVVIGVTGGVGAGKSECLKYLADHYHCLVIYADREAAALRARGSVCFDALVAALGEDVLDPDGEIDSRRMAEKMFADPALVETVNGILHPAVNALIRGKIAGERAAGMYDFLFLEAALLIENGYEQDVDALWYVYADPEVRRSRLKESRGYSDRKIDEIMAAQLSDAEYRRHCAVVIDNSGGMDETARQMSKAAGEYIGGTKRSAD